MSVLKYTAQLEQMSEKTEQVEKIYKTNFKALIFQYFKSLVLSSVVLT